MSDEIEEEPGYEHAAEQRDGAEQAGEGTTRLGLARGHFFQARGTDDPVIVLGDAFAAKEFAALRAARHCLAIRVVQAAALGETNSHLRDRLQRCSLAFGLCGEDARLNAREHFLRGAQTAE